MGHSEPQSPQLTHSTSPSQPSKEPLIQSSAEYRKKRRDIVIEFSTTALSNMAAASQTEHVQHGLSELKCAVSIKHTLDFKDSMT